MLFLRSSRAYLRVLLLVRLPAPSLLMRLPALSLLMRLPAPSLLMRLPALSLLMRLPALSLLMRLPALSLLMRLPARDTPTARRAHPVGCRAVGRYEAVRSGVWLAAQSEPCDERAVALYVPLAEIAELPTAAADELE